MNASTVLVVGAHPDDGCLGCGGTIRVFLKLGFRVQCVVLTRGERSGDPEVREREERVALTCLGVPNEGIHFGDFPDTAIPLSHDTIAFLERFGGDDLWAAFIPSAHETHQDHRNLAHACWSAFRGVQRLLAYESPSVTAQFQPNTFVDVNGHVKHKWRALNCHRSQVSQGKMYLQYRSITALAAFRGAQNGVRYAEAFEAIRLRIDWGAVLPRNRRGPGRARDRCTQPTTSPSATDTGLRETRGRDQIHGVGEPQVEPAFQTKS